MSESGATGQAWGAMRTFGLVMLGAGVTGLAWLIWAAGEQGTPISPLAPPGARAPPWADESVPQEIRKVLDDQAEAWNRRDLEGYMAGYLRSPRIAYLSGRDWTQGWEAALARYRLNYQGEGKEMGRLTFDDLDVRLLRPDLAQVGGRWKVVGARETLDGLFTLIMWRTPDGWRIVHDHTSAGPKPPAKKKGEPD